MKLLILSFLVAVALAMPDKRNLFDDLTTTLHCEGLKYEEACKACCNDASWTISVDQTACVLACNILPDKADYDATTDFPYSTIAPAHGK